MTGGRSQETQGNSKEAYKSLSAGGVQSPPASIISKSPTTQKQDQVKSKSLSWQIKTDRIPMNENDTESERGSSSTTSGTTSPSPTEMNGTESSSSPPSKKKSSVSKKDRSCFRKGKWTIEEEEYTSRIIHHFSTGLLTLPEGTTLRSYLAEKLNCDPMRITKKYAGASCLGKRVYHLCDRSHATMADIEMAKEELARLELRFRLRIEHGQTGMPLPPRADVMPSLQSGPSSIFAPNPQTAVAAASQWLQIAGMAQVLSSGTSIAAPSYSMPQPNIPVSAPAATGMWPMHQAAPQWLAPTSIPNPTTTPGQPKTAPNGAPPLTNDAMAQLAWAQAAASLTPALNQLAASNLHQHQQQLQNAYQAQFQKNAYHAQFQKNAAPVVVPTSMMAPPLRSQASHESSTSATANSTTSVHPLNSANTTQVVLSQPKVSIAPPVAGVTPVMAPPPRVSASVTPSTSVTANATPKTSQLPVLVTSFGPVASPKQLDIQSAVNARPLSNQTEDEVAGSMLLGFLSSLRKSFNDAVEQKNLQEGVALIGKATPILAPQQTTTIGSSQRVLQKTKKMTTKNLACTNQVSSGSSQEGAAFQYSVGSRTECSSGWTSHPGDSSMEETESNSSDNAVPKTNEITKEGPSSSDDSDGLYYDRGYGPPRKRYKQNKPVFGHFTSKNIAEHNQRMHSTIGSVSLHKFAQKQVKQRKTPKRPRADT